MENNPDFEVIIIGGSYAGLSAAMSLGRSLRKVLIIDSGKPCNWQTPHAHNFITHDGKTPAAIVSTYAHTVIAIAHPSFPHAVNANPVLPSVIPACFSRESIGCPIKTFGHDGLCYR